MGYFPQHKTISYSSPECGTFYSCALNDNSGATSFTGQQQQVWNNHGLQSWVRSDASQTRIASLKTACSNVKSNSANIWMPGAGDYSSLDFGMPSPDKCEKATICTESQYFDGSSCVSGQMTDFNKVSGGTSCGAGLYWDTRTNGCKSMESACGEANGVWDPSSSYCKMPNSTYTAPVGSCSGSQYWNGSACVTSSTGSSYSTDPATGCAQAGGSWDAATNFCRMPTSLNLLSNSLLGQLYYAVNSLFR